MYEDKINVLARIDKATNERLKILAEEQGKWVFQMLPDLIEAEVNKKWIYWLRRNGYGSGQSSRQSKSGSI